jgi:hypothetical protein
MCLYLKINENRDEREKQLSKSISENTCVPEWSKDLMVP